MNGLVNQLKAHHHSELYRVNERGVYRMNELKLYRRNELGLYRMII